MKARLLTPQMVRNPGWPSDGTPKYSEQPAGTIIDNPQAFMLVRNGQAEPADEECKAACPFWNEDTKNYLTAWYDQKLCGAITGDPKHDSKVGVASAISRMKERLTKAQMQVSDDPVVVMTAHLELCKALKAKSDESRKQKRSPGPVQTPASTSGSQRETSVPSTPDGD